MVKSWLVQDQTVLGKDYSNLLIADSLLKTIWFINAPCYGNEALASPKANELTIPEQTATGKGTSNPFMAGSLPKTTKPTYFSFLSTEVKGSTLKQSTAEPAHIPKGYTQAISSKVPTAPNCVSHSDEIICSFFAQQASMPTTHDDEDLLQIDEDAMEEIDIRWQVAMITARIRNLELDASTCTLDKLDLMNLTGAEKADEQPISLAIKRLQTQRYEQMGYDLKDKRYETRKETKGKELDQALKERDDFKVKLEKWSNASVLQNEVLNKQRYVSDKSCIGFGIESSNSMESDISSGDETLTDSTYENFKREKAYKAVPPPTDWVDSDDEETDVSESQKETAFNSENSETSFENRSPNSVGQESRTKGLGNKGGSTVGSQAVLPQTVKQNAMISPKQTWKPKGNYLDSGNPEEDLKDYAIIDSGCSGSMTGDKDKLSDFKEFKANVEELKFNLLSVSKICEKKKHNVLDSQIKNVLSYPTPKFKFDDRRFIILRAPRKNDVYNKLRSKEYYFPSVESLVFGIAKANKRMKLS
ncbi:hypothetical protein Tco_0071439 [Tanacetum coccineum]